KSKSIHSVYSSKDEGHLVVMNVRFINRGVCSNVDKNINLTIYDDIIADFDRIYILFINDNKIRQFDVTIKSGKYFEKRVTLNENSEESYDDIANTNVVLISDNPITQFKVKQLMKTENIYSYRGNQDGFSSSVVHININPKKI